jgi:hypothetical protein
MQTRSETIGLSSLKPASKILIGFGVAVLIACTSCTFQRSQAYAPDIMPEAVYIATVSRKAYRPKIAFCAFAAPTYARSTGEKAAILLYRETLKQHINANFTYVGCPVTDNVDALTEFARENRYEFIVGGKVLSYMDGGISTASRVEQEIRVYQLSSHRLRTVGYAKALEEVAPDPSADYIFFLEMSQPAPSAESLMGKNAQKFAALLAYMFPAN